MSSTVGREEKVDSRITAAVITVSNWGTNRVQSSATSSAVPSFASTDAPESNTETADVQLSLSSSVRKALAEQAKHLQDMQTALNRLQKAPSWSEVAKAAAKERAALLKKLLQMMKQMMAGASPAQAKAMASQLKDIARELAALASTLGKGGSESSGSAQVLTLNSAASSDSSDNGAASGADASAANVQAEGTGESNSVATAPALEVPVPASQENEREDEQEDEQKQEQERADAQPLPADVAAQTLGQSTLTPRQASAAYAQQERAGEASKSSSEHKAQRGDDDKELKALLKDARKLLQQLVHMIKNKLGAAKKDVQEAAHQLAKLSEQLNRLDDQEMQSQLKQWLEEGVTKSADSAASADIPASESSALASGSDGGAGVVADAGGAGAVPALSS